MTQSELAAVLERIAGDWIFRTPATETALRESAAILRRLGDDAIAEAAAYERGKAAGWHECCDAWGDFEGDLPDGLRYRYPRPSMDPKPAEPVRDVCRWRLAHGDSIDFYEPSCNKFQAFSKVHSACPDCGKPIQIEGEKP